MKTLRDYATYSVEKVDNAKLDSKCYIGVDNMVPDRGGVTDSEYVPILGHSTLFEEGDILLGNIRPYFKKIWLADRKGGASADVLVIKPNDKRYSAFLYAVLSQDSFFDYDMTGSKGSKMPRGDKNHIMSFPVIDIKNKESAGKLLINIENKIMLNKKINDNLYQSAMAA